jgi:hypothetical protein
LVSRSDFDKTSGAFGVAGSAAATVSVSLETAAAPPPAEESARADLSDLLGHMCYLAIYAILQPVRVGLLLREAGTGVVATVLGAAPKAREGTRMDIRFWGTRGSLAKPGRATLRHGGNTSCVEVRGDDGTLIVLDCAPVPTD